MRSKHLALCVPILLLALCGRQKAQDLDKHVTELFKYMRWLNYWEGNISKHFEYVPGKRVEALFFWRRDHPIFLPYGRIYDEVGFCAPALVICLFYPDHKGMSYEQEIDPNQSALTSFQSFLTKGFDNGLLSRRKDKFSTQKVTRTWPTLDPPDAILERNMRPREEIDRFVNVMGCRNQNGTSCTARFLIPFYDQSDPRVYIYWECVTNCNDSLEPAILVAQIQGNRLDPTYARTITRHTVFARRHQIEKALMMEIVK